MSKIKPGMLMQTVMVAQGTVIAYRNIRVVGNNTITEDSFEIDYYTLVLVVCVLKNDSTHKSYCGVLTEKHGYCYISVSWLVEV